MLFITFNNKKKLHICETVTIKLNINEFHSLDIQSFYKLSGVEKIVKVCRH